jgi:hypothetical protein
MCGCKSVGSGAEFVLLERDTAIGGGLMTIASAAEDFSLTVNIDTGIIQSVISAGVPMPNRGCVACGPAVYLDVVIQFTVASECLVVQVFESPGATSLPSHERVIRPNITNATKLSLRLTGPIVTLKLMNRGATACTFAITAVLRQTGEDERGALATLCEYDRTSCVVNNAVVVKSPIYYCADYPHPLLTTGGVAAQNVRQVRGPGVDLCLVLATASAGATLALNVDDRPDMSTLKTLITCPVAAAATTPLATFLAALAAAPKTINSPAPFWQLVFTNGASNQAAGSVLFSRGGTFT